MLVHSVWLIHPCCADTRVMARTADFKRGCTRPAAQASGLQPEHATSVSWDVCGPPVVHTVTPDDHLFGVPGWSGECCPPLGSIQCCMMTVSGAHVDPMHILCCAIGRHMYASSAPEAMLFVSKVRMQGHSIIGQTKACSACAPPSLSVSGGQSRSIGGPWQLGQSSQSDHKRAPGGCTDPRG